MEKCLDPIIICFTLRSEIDLDLVVGDRSRLPRLVCRIAVSQPTAIGTGVNEHFLL